MFAISSLDAVNTTLTRVYGDRQTDGLLPQNSTLRGPVGLFVIREDGSFGSKIAEEVVQSFNYWDARSKHYFDGVFLGWGYDGGPAFMPDEFEQCVADLEGLLSWEDRGGAYLLITDFVYATETRQGVLDFSRVIPLDITQLLTKEKYPQLSHLVAELIAPMKDAREVSASVSVSQVSDYIALLRSRRFFWDALVKKLGPLLGWADDLAPYAVRDLRRQK